MTLTIPIPLFMTKRPQYMYSNYSTIPYVNDLGRVYDTISLTLHGLACWPIN